MVESDNRKLSSFISPLSQSFQRAEEKKKQSEVLKYQNQMFSEWRALELKYQGKFLLIHNFVEQLCDGWKVADFSVVGDYDVNCEVKSDWIAVPKQAYPLGFELNSKIILPRPNIRLRSLACDLKMRIKLVGDSTFIIVSRSPGTIEDYSTVTKITRDTSLKGLFVMFGYIESISHKFFYNKQVQIPEDYSLKSEDSNFDELEILFSDNGDSRIYLSVSSIGENKSIKQFATFCDNFMPYIDKSKSKILIGGNGESVALKYISIQQRERHKNKPPVRDKECCCSII
jgi:hypothetical protein